MMTLSNKEIDNIVLKTINDNKLKKINNIYLSNRQIDILNMYNIDYKNVTDIKQLIFKIEDYLYENNYIETDELENLSLELSEFNYYYNTNK